MTADYQGMILEYMRLRNWRNADVARHFGITQKTIGTYVKGKSRKPTTYARNLLEMELKVERMKEYNRLKEVLGL